MAVDPLGFGALQELLGNAVLVFPPRLQTLRGTSLTWGFIVFSEGFPLLVKTQGLDEVAWTAPALAPGMFLIEVSRSL